MSGQGIGAPFTPDRGRELVGRLREAGQGSVFVTCGLRDLRLVVSPGEVGLEAAGSPLGGGDARDLIRAFLCALFWEDPIAVHDGDAVRREDVASLRVYVDPDGVLVQIEQGLTELAELRRRVPSLEMLLQVSGAALRPDDDAPAARLFRVASSAPNGMLLAQAAEEAGLDTIDAAWAVVDLLEAKQATVRRLSPTVAMRRLRSVEALVEDGLLPGLRHEYVARGLVRAEPRRAALFLRQAGDLHRSVGRAEQALACYTGSLDIVPDDLGAREGLVLALSSLGRAAEARAVRLALVERYVAARLPRRARAHLAELGELTLEQQATLLDCLLAAGEGDEAAEVAAHLAPRLPAQERAVLPARFVAAGIGGAPLERAVRASGIARLRPLRRALVGVVAVGLLAVAGLGLEAYARVQFARAVQGAHDDLAAGRFDEARARFAELAHLTSSLAADRWPVATCLAEVPRVQAELDALEADQALLDANLSLLRWRSGSDSLAADRALSDLAARARTDDLRRLLEAERAEIAVYRQRVLEDLKVLQDLVIAGRAKDALDHARHIVDAYHDARDLFADRWVSVRVACEPREALLNVDGKLHPPTQRGSGQWEVRVRLDGRPVVLELQYPNHVTQRRAVRFEDLTEPELSFELIGVHQDKDLPWPEEPAGPGVHFVEDPRTITQLRATARGPLRLETDAARARLAEALPPLPRGQRLVVVAHSDPGRRRAYLRELTVFFSDGDRRATPWHVNVGRVDRPLTDEPSGTVLHDLSRVERFPVIVEALREVLHRMQQELAR